MAISQSLKARREKQKSRSSRRREAFAANNNHQPPSADDSSFNDFCDDENDTVDSDAVSLERLTRSTPAMSRLSELANNTVITAANSDSKISGSTSTKIHSLNNNLNKYRAAATAHAHESAVLQSKLDSLKHVQVMNTKQQGTIDSLNSKISELSSNLKESEYNCLMINKRLEKEKQNGEEGKLKTKATLKGMRSALLAVEEAVRERAVGAKKHIKELEVIHESFARHLKHGYSSSPSYTAFQLLEKMNTTLAGLKNSIQHCDDGVNDAAVRNAAEVSASLYQSSGKNGESISNTMADICSELERENARLRRELDTMNEKLHATQMDADNAMKLLPEYRLEIVRARSSAESAKRELKGEREAIVHLQRRLDECVVALRESEDARVGRIGEGGGVGWGEGGVQVQPPPTPTISTSPSRKTTIENEKLIFSQLLRSSNDKLLQDMKAGIKNELENVVSRQTDIILSSSMSSEK